MDDLAFYFVEERSKERYCGVNCRIYYHRIFERKWRMGAGLRVRSPCMPYLSVEQQKPLSSLSLREGGLVQKQTREPEHRRDTSVCAARGGENLFSSGSRWLGVCCVVWPRGRRSPPKPKNKKNIAFFDFFCVSLFTDLSTAGLPAELKHITQRRKRKQP